MQQTDATTRLGQRVRSLRLARGWTQRVLAARLGCGVAQQSIDQLEKGRIRRPRYMPELARAFDCDLAWLLSGETKPIDRDRLAAAILATETALRRHTRSWSAERCAEIVARVYGRSAGVEVRAGDMLERMADAEIEADTPAGPIARLWQRLWSGWGSWRRNPT